MSDDGFVSLIFWVPCGFVIAHYAIVYFYAWLERQSEGDDMADVTVGDCTTLTTADNLVMGTTTAFTPYAQYTTGMTTWGTAGGAGGGGGGGGGYIVYDGRADAYTITHSVIPTYHPKVAETRGLTLLFRNLTPDQLASYDTNGWFEVKGNVSGHRYRIGYSSGVQEVDEHGVVCSYCVGPEMHLVRGDVMLALKIGFESDEAETLKVANRFGERNAAFMQAAQQQDANLRYTTTDNAWYTSTAPRGINLNSWRGIFGYATD